MADLNVERKKHHNVWPWVVGLLVVLLAVWAFAEWNDDEDALAGQADAELIDADPLADEPLEANVLDDDPLEADPLEADPLEADPFETEAETAADVADDADAELEEDYAP